MIFDYDSALADTEPLHWKSCVRMLEPYGIDCTWEDYRVHGLGVDDVEMCDLIQRTWPHVNVSELLGRNAERKQFVCELSLAQLPIPREAIVFLATLNKYRLGLVTSSERAIVEPVLCACKLLDRFDARVFGGEAVKRKPSPEPYLLIRERPRIRTGVVFEDSSPGIESALAAGFTVVKIGSPFDLPRIASESLSTQGSDISGA